jgi:gamma-polyglutamate biosynthesis protein CapA
MKSCRLAAVGDIALGEHPLCLGNGIATAIARRGNGYVFDKVRSKLADADIVFGNLENMLADPAGDTAPFERRYLRGEPACISALAGAGFSVLNLANNHALQHGPAGLHRTMRLLDEHGVGHIGVRGRHTLVIEKRGVRVGLAGYCEDQQYEKQTVHVEPLDLATIERDLQDLKRRGAEALVVSLHWGHEFVQRPSSRQIEIGRAIIKLGAHLVIGHHPHVLQGVERVEGGVIAYSLGTFVSDCRWNPRMCETVILSCTLTPNGVTDVEFVPVYLNKEFQPETATGSAAVEIATRVESLSNMLWQDPNGLSPEVYRKLVRSARLRNRFQMYRQFVAHLGQYPPGVSRQILDMFLSNKLRRLAWTRARSSASSATIR